MKTRVAINGFGRIGRCTLKNFMSSGDVDVVAINDLADVGDLAYLLKYDSIHGWYSPKVRNDESSITVDNHRIDFFSEPDPRKLPWKKLGVDVVIECTGAFRARDKAATHLEAGARRVILSAPGTDVDNTIVMGVNHTSFNPEKDFIISNASCTTNSLAPVAKVLNDTFGVEHIMITTVHAYTSSQALMDTPVRKRRRGRAAALSIIPTTTGAARATALVLPELEGRMDGMALRVPVPDGSVTDVVATLQKDATPEAINDAVHVASTGPMKGILRLSDEALVSRDIIGDPHSAIVDAESTNVLRKRVAKVLIWYDNEWGYSARLADLTRYVVSNE